MEIHLILKNCHPETAFRELTEQHFIKPLIPGHGLPRLKALYAIEDALYRTDKHVADNIDHMCAAFMDANLHIEDIENIYVLGHSFGNPDAEYFDYIDKTTLCGCDFETLSAAGRWLRMNSCSYSRLAYRAQRNCYPR